ncbi:MAG: lysostaphin resistance A-like protein [Verrucomicrobiia bacterium]
MLPLTAVPTPLSSIQSNISRRIFKLGILVPDFLNSLMRPVWFVGLYAVVVFGGGALFAPWLYQGTQAAAEAWSALEPLASQSFPRFVNRCLLLFALVGLWPFMRAVGLDSWAAAGLTREPQAAAYVGWGVAFGLVSLCCIAMIAMGGGARYVADDFTVTTFLVHLLRVSLTAVVVSSLEEILFRGALFGTLRKGIPWKAALVTSSALFAMLHFLQRVEAPSEIGWDSGFAVLAGMAMGFQDLDKVLPGFLNLFLVGAILTLTYQRTGSLYFSIGLHAGWILWLRSYGFLTKSAPIAQDVAQFYGTSRMVNGWLAFIVLAVVLLMVSRFMLRGGQVFAANRIRES